MAGTALFPLPLLVWRSALTTGRRCLKRRRAPFSRSTLQGRYLSRQYADDENRQPIADFVVIDASIHKPIAKGIRMFLNGENLTNRRYIATQTGSVKTLGVPLLVMGGIRVEY